MNRDRRRRLRAVIERAGQLLEQLRIIEDEERTAYFNVPESLQNSERYEDMEIAVEALDEATDSLGEIIERLGELT